MYTFFGYTSDGEELQGIATDYAWVSQAGAIVTLTQAGAVEVYRFWDGEDFPVDHADARERGSWCSLRHRLHLG